MTIEKINEITKQIKDSKLSMKDLGKIKDFLEKENTAPEENDTSKKSNILETKNTEWEDLKNEILNNLSNELDPKGPGTKERVKKCRIK